MDQLALSDLVDYALNEYDRRHYQSLTKYAHSKLEEKLTTINENKNPDQDGLLAKVSSRTKTIESLRQNVKINNRNKSFKKWKTIRDTYSDLAGVRLTVYIPGEKSRQKAKKLIMSIWPTARVSRPFGKDNKRKVVEEDGDGLRNDDNDQGEAIADSKGNQGYQSIHLGYQAVHYVVNMTSAPVDEKLAGDVGYSPKPGDKFEIQVVSALSHGWAEAQHDVLYKSAAYGKPSEAEGRILDAVNGILLSGDLLLEQFYELFYARVYKKFDSLEDLIVFLRELELLRGVDDNVLPEDDWDNVSDLLQAYDKNYPMAIRETIKQMGPLDIAALKQYVENSFTDPILPEIDPKMLGLLCLAHVLDKKDTCSPSHDEMSDPLLQAEMINSICEIVNALATNSADSFQILFTEDPVSSTSNDIHIKHLEWVVGQGEFKVWRDAKRWSEPKREKTLMQNVPPLWDYFKQRANDAGSLFALLFRIGRKAGPVWFIQNEAQKKGYGQHIFMVRQLGWSAILPFRSGIS